MGTTVLFPQDCLPISRGRHRHDLSDSFVGSPTSSKSTFQLFNSYYLCPSNAGHSFTPYHRGGPLYWDQTRNRFAPCQADSLKREVGQKKLKFEKLGEPRKFNSAGICEPSSASFTILQRPNESDSAQDLIGRLLNKSDTIRSTTGVCELKLDAKANRAKPCKSVQNFLLDGKKKNGPNGRKNIFDLENGKKGALGAFNSEMGKPKYQGCNLGLPRLQDAELRMLMDQAFVKDLNVNKCKLQNVPRGAVKARRSFDNRYNDMMTQSKGLNHASALRISAEHVSPKLTCKDQPLRFNAVGEGLTRLRRASTDPQIVEHLGHYRSQVSEIPCGQGNSCHGFTRSTSMPFPAERWAGPAYVTSPAPSSLPLPKFSLVGQKIPSLDVTPLLVKRQNSNITKPTVSGSVSAESRFLHAEGELDVVFATKSLRRMLRLDQA